MKAKTFKPKDKMSVLGIRTKEATKILIYSLLKKTYGNRYNKTEPTIGDLLSLDIEKNYDLLYCGQHIGSVFTNKNRGSVKTLHALRTKLLEAGYTENDGPFLYYATRNYYIDKVMKETSVPKEGAEISVIVAEKMGWIKML